MAIESIPAAVSSLKSAFDLAKFLRDTVPTLDRAEINLKLAELMNALANARGQIADIKDEVLERDAEIKRLSDLVRGTVRFERRFYWKTVEGKTEGPFCPACHDSKNGLLIRLHDYVEGWWVCKVCGERYEENPISSPRPPVDRDYNPYY